MSVAVFLVQRKSHVTLSKEILHAYQSEFFCNGACSCHGFPNENLDYKSFCEKTSESSKFVEVGALLLITIAVQYHHLHVSSQIQCWTGQVNSLWVED